MPCMRPCFYKNETVHFFVSGRPGFSNGLSMEQRTKCGLVYWRGKKLVLRTYMIFFDRLYNLTILNL